MIPAIVAARQCQPTAYAATIATGPRPLLTTLTDRLTFTVNLVSDGGARAAGELYMQSVRHDERRAAKGRLVKWNA
jgi:hypothetical protein